jgi:hypothetical protein
LRGRSQCPGLRLAQRRHQLAALEAIGAVTPQLASREGTDDQVVRLRRQVEALQREIGELTEAQQRATDTIASLRAEQEARDPAASGYWYSDLGALNYGIATPRPAGVAPPRSAAARSELRTRRRDTGGGTPLSLEAPQ